MRLDEKQIRHDAAKSAERREKCHLPNLLAEIEVQLRAVVKRLALRIGQTLLEGRSQRAKSQHDCQRDDVNFFHRRNIAPQNHASSSRRRAPGNNLKSK